MGSTGARDLCVINVRVFTLPLLFIGEWTGLPHGLSHAAVFTVLRMGTSRPKSSSLPVLQLQRITPRKTIGVLRIRSSQHHTKLAEES